MKEHLYEDLEEIQLAVTSVLNGMTSEDFRGAFKDGKNVTPSASELEEIIVRVWMHKFIRILNIGWKIKNSCI